MTQSYCYTSVVFGICLCYVACSWRRMIGSDELGYQRHPSDSVLSFDSLSAGLEPVIWEHIIRAWLGESHWTLPRPLLFVLLQQTLKRMR